jgi:hypothetical protein
LPSRARIRLEHFDLCTILGIDRIVEGSISLIRCARRKAFIVTGATVHAAIVLTRILAAILSGDKTVLGASIILGDRGRNYD